MPAGETTAAISPDVRVEAQKFLEGEPGMRGVDARVQSATRPPRAGVNIESLVGGRFFAVLGALGTVIGLALFLKLAYDKGWLGQIRPEWRCLGVAAAGVALLITGEGVRKRLGTWASAGVSAAGIAALYASGLAAYSMFQLIGTGTAFALLGVTSAAGVLIGARSRTPALSIISFVGAYLVPFVLSVATPSSLAHPAYLLALLAGGMALASWLRGGFRPVGVLVFVATILLGGVYVLGAMRTHPAVALGFAGCVWAVVHAALLFATRQRIVPETEGKVALPVGVWRTGVLLGSFISTAWGVFLGVVVLREATLLHDWLVPLAGVAVTGLIAITLCGHLRLFVERPSTEREYLGAGLLTQAGGLLIGVIIMAASGSTQLYLWLGLGVAGAVAGKWTGSKAVRVYALVLLSIATLRLGTIDALQVKRLATADVFGLMLTRWSMHCVMTAAAWMVASLSPIRFASRRPIRLTPGASAVCLLLMMACVLHPESSMGSIAVWWAIIGLAMGAFVHRAPVFILAEAIVALTMAAGLLVARGTMYPTIATVHVAGVALSTWSAQIAFVGVAWGVVAALAPARLRALPIATAAIGLALVGASVLHPTTNPANIVVVWTILGGLGVAAARYAPRLSLGSIGSLLAIAALIPWARTYIPWAGGDWHASEAPLGLHPGLWRAALAGFVLAWSYHRGRKEDLVAGSPRNSIGLLCACLCGLLAWCATSFEVARAARSMAEDQRAQLAAVSIWWGILSVGLIVFGFRRKRALPRHTGLGLMGLAAVKVVFFDLASVPAMWRVVSFLLLGLLMLGVALVYGRLSSRSAPSKDGPDQSDPPLAPTDR